MKTKTDKTYQRKVADGMIHPTKGPRNYNLDRFAAVPRGRQMFDRLLTRGAKINKTDVQKNADKARKIHPVVQTNFARYPRIAVEGQQTKNGRGPIVQFRDGSAYQGSPPAYGFNADRQLVQLAAGIPFIRASL